MTQVPSEPELPRREGWVEEDRQARMVQEPELPGDAEDASEAEDVVLDREMLDAPSMINEPDMPQHGDTD
ncbi:MULTISPECIES: hypothetical protein [unclassified Ornithinimicrobium]|uniref:hypothetical protein n=1 Tax=unclassified Ornithinimicrobium TaxID=2615080 RepID=UPI0038536B40